MKLRYAGLALALAAWSFGVRADPVNPDLLRIVDHAVAVRDYATAWTLLRAEADTGDPAAISQLALFEINGVGGAPKDRTTGCARLKKAAQGDFGLAGTMLAIQMNGGICLPRDPVQARSLLNQGVGQRIPAALNELATMLANGDGGPKDLTRARSLYNDASVLGFAPATVNLALMFHRGDGGLRDEAKARALLRPLADRDANAALQLAIIERAPGASAVDLEDARRLFIRAGSQGQVAGAAGLVSMYRQNQAGRADLQALRDGLRPEADKGSPAHLFILAELEREAPLADSDLAEARNLYGRAAARGHAGAALALARMQIDGIGGPKDLPAARRWLELLVKSGVTLAQPLLDKLPPPDKAS